MFHFVRPLHEGDFILYVQSCDELHSWSHAVDHTNYAHWLSVHVQDLASLAQKHPAFHAEFIKGIFVVQKSVKKFSLITGDQAHDQSNLIMQTHGGAAGFYEIPEAHTLFIFAEPDCAQMVKDFKSINNLPLTSIVHHEGYSQV